MEVKITITIEADKDSFDKRELHSDILAGFEERTGYEIKELHIEPKE